MSKKCFSFKVLPYAGSEGEHVGERRKLIARGVPEYGEIEVKISEVISRFSGDSGLSDNAVHYLTEESVKVFTE